MHLKPSLKYDHTWEMALRTQSHTNLLYDACHTLIYLQILPISNDDSYDQITLHQSSKLHLSWAHASKCKAISHTHDYVALWHIFKWLDISNNILAPQSHIFYAYHIDFSKTLPFYEPSQIIKTIEMVEHGTFRTTPISLHFIPRSSQISTI